MARYVSLTLFVTLFVTGCTTKYGVTVSADQVIPSHSKVEPLNNTSGVASTGNLLWAKPADRALYDQARQEALKDTNGTLLIDAKVTTRLISYFGLYYLTSVTIEGIAAKLIEPRPNERPPNE